MALAIFNFESEFLKGNTEICVILPNLPKYTAPEDFYGSIPKRLTLRNSAEPTPKLTFRLRVSRTPSLSPKRI